MATGEARLCDVSGRPADLDRDDLRRRRRGQDRFPARAHLIDVDRDALTHALDDVVLAVAESNAARGVRCLRRVVAPCLFDDNRIGKSNHHRF